MPKFYKIILVVFAVITLASLATAINFYSKLRAIENPNVVTQEEISKLVSEVGQYILLPQNETPTLATVSDPAKLKDQPFFANAHEGDKVLIYSTSRKAILWRPSVKKIIEVSAINVTAPAANTSN